MEDPPSVPEEGAPSASPAPPPTPPPASASPPVMLTTMTPVSVIELQKDLEAEATKNVYILPPQEQVETSTVSVVVQPPPLYAQQPATTVLVLSELVDDMGVIGLRKRRELEECGRMSEMPPGEGPLEDTWRPYYDHPLSAVTSAMLNMDDHAPNLSFVYGEKDKMVEIWSTGSAATGGQLVTSQVKTANGLGAGAGLELSQADLGGLFLQQPLPVQQVVKREPEDLSRHKAAGSPVHHDSIIKRHKVVLVANGGGEGGVVVDVVKQEAAAAAARSRTPSSTSSLLAADGTHVDMMAADGLKPYGAVYGSPSPTPYTEQHYTQAASGGGYVTAVARAPSAPFGAERYYGDYFPEQQAYGRPQQQQQQQAYADSPEAPAPAAYVRGAYHVAKNGLTVDLPSPDSGIGTDAVTPRDHTAIQQTFDYGELCPLSEGSLQGRQQPPTPAHSTPSRSRPWHDFGRQNDADKIQIQKVYSPYGFKYHLEAPISTSQRKEDDRITYINKGQFYGITMEYVPDPDKPLKSQTVKSVVMLMFREEKSPEDEIKAWQFWHSRQHSVKQRILDADTKNSVGLVGCIEEVAHNAIAVYWNPLESSAKISVAVQCLSTDFSSQKGVKGLPLHLQIDTYEDPRDATVSHRGYCQIKVFCDKGAERKTRDEERRAAKRKMTATGRKKLDELYHPAADRSEFYAMSDLAKPPVLFSPADDIDKLGMDLEFYSHESHTSSLSNGDAGALAKPFLLHPSKQSSTPTLKFHNHFPPDTPGEKKDVLESSGMTTDGNVFTSPALKRPKMMPAPSLNERVMLYVRQEAEDVYTPLHVMPPTTQGLLNAIENKYKISTSSISNLYRKNKKGIIAKIDNDMLKYYCNEDLFLIEIKQVDGDDCFEVTLVELLDH